MRIGSGRYRRFPGVRVPDQLSTKEYVHYSNFAGGHDSRDASEDVSENSSPDSLDMEVTIHDTLKRAPGTTLVETLTDRNPLPQFALHANLDNRSEMVLFAPPYFGVKEVGDTVWHEAGLPLGERPFAVANFGGTLIFSNGVSRVYARQPYQSTLEVIEEAPVAPTYATFAGRLWAGGGLVDGQREPYSMSWSAANSDYTDWSSRGAGFELLLSNVMSGDRVIALRPMGLDFMAILCRRSIWIGRRTGLIDRPADFQPRVPGVGAVSENTCVVTRFGVILLSDSGVYLFDGNNATLISQQINRDLLPIDFERINEYSAFYNPFTKRYYLFTPNETWVYDIDYNRWYKRSMVARAAGVLAEQFDKITWGEVVGTWGEQVKTWGEFSPEEGNEFQQFFMGQQDGEQVLVSEYALATTAFGLPVTPRWETILQQGKLLTQLFNRDDLLIHYTGSGTITLGLPDNRSRYQDVATIILPPSSVPNTVRRRLVSTGKGIGVKLQIVSGDVEILRMSVGMTDRGPRVEIEGGEVTLPPPEEQEPVPVPPEEAEEPPPDVPIPDPVEDPPLEPEPDPGEPDPDPEPEPDPEPDPEPEPTPEAPAVPTGLDGVVVSHTRIDLSWDAVPEAEEYRVYRGGALIAAVVGLGYSAQGLQASREYSFQVSAWNVAGGESARSDAILRTTLAMPEPELPPGALFATSFEEGEPDWFSFQMNGASWRGKNKNTATQGQGRTGQYGMRFRFPANTVPFQHQTSELMFRLAPDSAVNNYPEVNLEMYLKPPANYYHTFLGNTGGEMGVRRTYGQARMTQGSNILELTGGDETTTHKTSWIPQDVGIVVSVPGAGGPGEHGLFGYIAEVISSTKVRLALIHGYVLQPGNTAMTGIKSADRGNPLNGAGATVSNVTVYRVISGATNHKFLALHGGKYSSSDGPRPYTVFQLWPDATIAGAGNSFLRPHFAENGYHTKNLASMPGVGQPGGMVRGVFNKVQIHAFVGTGPGAGDGILRVRVNDAMIFEDLAVPFYATTRPSDGAAPQSLVFNKGYLLGWANLGNATKALEECNWYMDDVVWNVGEPSW